MALFPTAVVVGTDGSEQSRKALEAAVELCAATGSSLHLLHVKLTDRGLRGRPMTPRQRETTDEEGQRLLEREAQAAAELGLEVSGTHLRYGEQLGPAMAGASGELDAGLLVIGEPSSGRMPQWLSRGYSTSTVRRAPGSVMVVR